MDSACHGTFQGTMNGEVYMSTANMKVTSITSKLLGYGSCTLYAHGFMIVKQATQGETYLIILPTIVRQLGPIKVLLRYHSVQCCHIHNNFHFVTFCCVT